MHVLLASFGTDGDVFPFVGLGIRLRARGHRVTLAANEHFGALASGCGFEFRSLVSEVETQALMGHPDVWHPLRSALHGGRWARRQGYFTQYEIIKDAARDPGTVIVAYPPVFAARVAQEKLGCPLVSLVPLPWLILSNTAPPALPGAARFPWLQSPRAARCAWRLGEMLTDSLLQRQLNRLRRSLGLGAVRGIYRWCFSPQMTVGLFPDWYAPPQTDWPRNTRTAGFSMYDGAKGKEFSAELLEFCRAGKPVVFTFGTGMQHGKDLFRASLECCKALNLRGVFVTKFPQQLPAELPGSVRPCSYAPFSQLFPECAAVVHHGGAGTTAQALSAGLPQLILPLAWDQPDNAFRVKRLGAGDWIQPHSSPEEMARALAAVIRSERQERCRELARRFEGVDSLEKAAEWIEENASAGKMREAPR